MEIQSFYIMRHFTTTLSSNANFITFMLRTGQKIIQKLVCMYIHSGTMPSNILMIEE